MMDCAIEMDARQQLLERLSRLQGEIVVIDGLVRAAVGTKVAGRLVVNLLETANAIEALLLVRS